MTSIDRFRGLNNVADPINLGVDWLTRADNVDVTPEGGLQLRTGYRPTALTAPLHGAFATRDESRLYVAGAALQVIEPDLSARELVALQSTARMHWAEVNDRVFFSNGTDAGIITGDGQVLPWRWRIPASPTLRVGNGQLPAGLYRACCTFVLADGRETGASYVADISLAEPGGLLLEDISQAEGCRTNVYIAPADSTVLQLAVRETLATALAWNQPAHTLGRELANEDRYPLPQAAGPIAFFQGRLVVAQYFPEDHQTALWRSDPFAHHLFDATAVVMVPGEVVALADGSEALLIGTLTELHAWNPEGMRRVAPYGMPPGSPCTRDKDERLLFWTNRGLCTAFPFANLTQDRASVAPGLQAGAAVINADGQQRFVALLHAGGTAFNPRRP